MKILLVLLISLSANASELKVCQEFVNTVLTPDISMSSSSEDHGYRLSKDEAKALSFISKYDASKLGHDLAIKNNKLAISECKHVEDKKFSESYCQSLLPNYNFLRALIHAMKFNQWSPKAVEVSKQKLFDYFKTLNKEGLPLVDMAVAATVLHYYVSEFPAKAVTPAEALKLKMEIEKAAEKLKSEADKGKKKACKDFQRSMKNELKVADSFRKRLHKMISKI